MDSRILLLTSVLCVVFHTLPVRCNGEMDEIESCGFSIGMQCVFPFMGPYQGYDGMDGDEILKTIQTLGLSGHCKMLKSIYKCIEGQMSNLESACGQIDEDVRKKLAEIVVDEYKALTYICDDEFKAFNKTFNCLFEEENFLIAFFVMAGCGQESITEDMDECTSMKEGSNCLIKAITDTCGDEGRDKETVETTTKAVSKVLQPIREVGDLNCKRALRSRTFRTMKKYLRF